MVWILIVPPRPPDGTPTRPVLYTCRPDTPSDARFEKSKERDWPLPPRLLLRPKKPGVELAAGIWRPFRVTMLKAPPKPRIVTSEPSPSTRLMDTPVTRCSDSARLVSGNLPMSSAEMASITPEDSRLTSRAAVKLPRIPVTTISSRPPPACCALAWPAIMDKAADTAVANLVFCIVVFISPIFITSSDGQRYARCTRQHEQGDIDIYTFSET